MLTVMFEKRLKLALVLAISIEHFILKSHFANAKKTLFAVHIFDQLY